jgi:hypothetical protein
MESADQFLNKGEKINILEENIELMYPLEGGSSGDILLEFYPLERKQLKKGILSRLDAVSDDTLKEIWERLQGDSVQGAAQPTLPSVAPALWSDRTTGREVSPVDFIREHYGRWIENGLTRPDIKRLDGPLYRAHTTFISRNGGVDPLNLPKKSDVVEARVSSSDFDDLRHAARRYQADRQKRYRMSRT